MSYPILIAENEWYKSTKTLRSEIKIVNIKVTSNPSYAPDDEVDEEWSADTKDISGKTIKCYIKGTTLTIVGINTEKIAMNPNSKNVFSGTDKFSQLTDIYGADNLDTSQVTTMYSAFNGCKALTAINVSNWDLSKVTSTAGMFNGCEALETLKVSNWDLGAVTSMAAMFQTCKKLDGLDVSKWNVINVGNGVNSLGMRAMFSGCKALKELDVSNWDVGNVTSMRGMFNGCEALETLDVSKWSTVNVKDMYQMFYQCYSLTALDVSNWSTEKVTNIADMFGVATGYKSQLEKIVLGKNFSFAGNGTCNPVAVLPTPDDPEIIAGADGRWYSDIDESYEPKDVPSARAVTYYASKKLLLSDRTYLIQGRTLVNLAEKIRTLTNTKEEITLNQMVNKIQDVYNAGVAEGKTTSN